MSNTPYVLKFLSGKTINLGKKTCIMGILNVTPDSFSDGGDFFNIDLAVKHALELQEQGADILDIGGESSRPGAMQVSAEEELKRIEPIIRQILPVIKIPISVDTYKASVASKVLSLSADIMINDISALRMDSDMLHVVKESNAPIVLMHMQGTPKNMQTNPHYDDVVGEIIDFFKEKIEYATKNGINLENIIIDPGIGFGKTIQHNLEIIKSLERFKSLNRPILMGTSRKSFIGNILNLPPKDRLEGTASTIAISIMNGANIVRVHDVLEMKRVAQMTDAIMDGLIYQ